MENKDSRSMEAMKRKLQGKIRYVGPSEENQKHWEHINARLQKVCDTYNGKAIVFSLKPDERKMYSYLKEWRTETGKPVNIISLTVEEYTHEPDVYNKQTRKVEFLKLMDGLASIMIMLNAHIDGEIQHSFQAIYDEKRMEIRFSKESLDSGGEGF